MIGYKEAYGNAASPFAYEYRVTAEQPVDGYYHSHSSAELLYVHRGDGRVVVRERTYDIRPGVLFYFQPYQLHRVHADKSRGTPYVRTIMHFVPSLMEEKLQAYPELLRFFRHLTDGSLPEQGFPLGRDRAGFEALLRAHAEEAAGPSFAGWRSEEASLLFAQAVQLVRKLAGSREETQGTRLGGNSRHSEAVMKWVNARYGEAFDLDGLASDLHVSKYHLSRAFRAETGSSITEYLIARRLKEACRLLRTSALAIEAIGCEVGVGNASYFSQLFRKHIGITPHQYRARK